MAIEMSIIIQLPAPLLKFWLRLLIALMLTICCGCFHDFDVFQPQDEGITRESYPREMGRDLPGDSSVQVHDLNIVNPEGVGCNSNNCGGCCLTDDKCAAGVSDNSACGKGGVDCTSCGTGKRCFESVCCTINCSNKICGETDDCGGDCTAGSGCCTPQCANQICGDGEDGCGRLCTAGTGCCADHCFPSETFVAGPGVTSDCPYCCWSDTEHKDPCN